MAELDADPKLGGKGLSEAFARSFPELPAEAKALARHTRSGGTPRDGGGTPSARDARAARQKARSTFWRASAMQLSLEARRAHDSIREIDVAFAERVASMSRAQV